MFCNQAAMDIGVMVLSVVARDEKKRPGGNLPGGYL